MARLSRFLQEDVLRLEPEGETETLETKVVSHGVEGVHVDSNGGAELDGDVPQPLEETVEAVTLVPRERVRQLTAEQIGYVPRDVVKYSAAAAGTTVAKPLGDGEARLPGIAKSSATTAFLGVVPTVAKSFLSVASFGGGRRAPQAGEIVGILKQLKVRMSTDLSGLKKEELDRVEDGHDMVHVSVVVKLTDEIDESASTSSRDNHVESNAFNPLDQAVVKVGHKLRSMCLIPTNKGGQACESVGVLWLPREACSDRNDGSVGKHSNNR